MRRLVRVLVVFVAIAGATAAAAWADKPDKTPSPGNPPTTFPAGVVCPFDLTVADVVNESTTTTHYDKLGNVLWQHGSGRIVDRFTNEATGKFVDLNISGPGKITEGADGLIHIDGTGGWSLFFFPTDSPSSTALYIKGHFALTFDPETGVLTLVSYTGTAQNICTMLS